MSNGVLLGMDRTGFGLVGVHVCKADSGMVVDRDEQVFPTGLDQRVRETSEAAAHLRLDRQMP